MCMMTHDLCHCVAADGGTGFSIDFAHRLDHLGPETEPDTLRRGYKSIGLVELSEQDKRDGIGGWGLRIVPKL
eukprot:SAG22_NODE_2427_length_2582_cov_1.272251_1_plen_73_part_00